MHARYYLLTLSCLTLFTKADIQGLRYGYSSSLSTFALNVLRVYSESSSENILFSPTSIDILLSQLQQGASGVTAKELADVLGRDINASRIAYSHLMKSFFSENREGVTINLAAKMFLMTDSPISENFQTISAENFHSQAENYNLASPDAAAYINKWVSTATNNNINDIITQDALSDDTKMVLVSAMFFKGLWKDALKKGQNNKFRLSKDEVIDVPYIYTARRLEAGEDKELGLKWVKVPYKDEKFVMMLILPSVKFQLDSIISNLTSGILLDLVNSNETRYVRLRMPILSLRSKMSLKNPLCKIGLNSMFDNTAEFPEIASGVKVSDVVHSALLEVNDEGTKAAAATGIYVTTLSLTVHSDELQFTANQPFLTIIMDKERNVPHFIAKVTNPI